ncbi:hypothetical protein SeLEV6574_g07880 [Synchytrium endobioticum]|uniref:Uncharacterized protein n=1 Tax=Synchytrium endobioticum TaxID=286115 RepID=A0A507CJ70_9FUNG|nr:hypothetical protein SeLEV6574_g07880 [Synchytrium endobioticum]
MERISTILLIAVMAFITLPALTLAVPDSSDMRRMMIFLTNKRTTAIRMQDKYIESPFFTSLATHPTPTSLLDKEIADLAADCLPPKSPYTMDELSAPPYPESMHKTQIRLGRAYNECVFETLKSLFMNLHTYAAARNPGNPVLLDAVAHFWDVLQLHFSLAKQYRVPCNAGNRVLELPLIVAGPNGISQQCDPETHWMGQTIKKSRRTTDYNIAFFISRIDSLRRSLETAITEVRERHLHDNKFRKETGTIMGQGLQSRFKFFQSTKKWTQTWTYRKLKQVSITELRWLPVSIAHERLIIVRCCYDMIRLQFHGGDHPAKEDKLSHRGTQYEKFLNRHKKQIGLYKQALLEGDVVSDTTVSVPHTTDDAIAPTCQRPTNPNVIERDQSQIQAVSGTTLDMLDSPTPSANWDLSGIGAFLDDENSDSMDASTDVPADVISEWAKLLDPYSNRGLDRSSAETCEALTLYRSAPPSVHRHGTEFYTQSSRSQYRKEVGA